MSVVHEQSRSRKSFRRRRARVAPALTTNPTQSNQNLYDQLFTQIQASFLSDFIGPDKQLLPEYQFQFPNPVQLQPAAWVSLVNNNFQPYEMFEAGDLAPISKQGSYTTGPNSTSIFTYYGRWLAAVTPPSVTGLPAYLAAQQDAMVAAQSMAAAVTGAGPAFAAYKSANPTSTITTVESWLTQTPLLPQSLPYALNYQTAYTNYLAQLATLAQLAADADPDLSAAQTAYGNSAFRVAYATAPGLTVTAGNTFIGSTDGSLNPVNDWTAWSQGQTNPNLNPFTATVAAGVQPVSHVEAVTIEETVETSYFFGLFSMSETELVTFFQTVTVDEHFQLDMNWGSLVMYPVSRPGWFDATVLQSYANSPLVASNHIDFFSQDAGALSLVPEYIFLGWNPSLTLTLDTDLYNQYQGQLQAESGAWFNGIVVPGAPTSVTAGPNGTTIVQYGTPASPASMQQLPTIVGYVNQVPTAAQ